MYSCGSFKNDPPGCINSSRINTLKEVPSVPAQRPIIKYRDPIRLWLEVYIQSTGCYNREIKKNEVIDAIPRVDEEILNEVVRGWGFSMKVLHIIVI